MGIFIRYFGFNVLVKVRNGFISLFGWLNFGFSDDWYLMKFGVWIFLV